MTELLHEGELSINIDYHGEKQQSFKSVLEMHLIVVYSPTSSHKEYFNGIEDALPTLSDCCNLTDHIRLPIIHAKTYINIE